MVKQNANIIAREVELVQKQAEIKHAEAKIEYERQVAAAQNDKAAVAEAKVIFAAAKQQIQDDFKKEVASTVEEKTKELTQKSTESILKKAEDKKKTIVEDDVRARLRGFARTIPSFLMAYGTSGTTLANFDENIKDEVFKEVTGITLDQFRALRDIYNFFDGVVFDESVQEFMHKKEQLADYFDDSRTEDIFDYIPPQKTNQIFTPKKIVKLMIDKLEEENPDIFKDKDRTFADLYVKSGLYLTEIVKRLYAGLADVIPDRNERLTHILENQIYGFAPSEIIYNIAKNYVFSGYAGIGSSHLVCRDLTELAKSGGKLEMKFDVVVGNPPYQEEAVGTSKKDLPIYPYFYNLAEQVAPRYVLISPARFLFNAGATNTNWNEKMLSDEHLTVVHYLQNSADAFPNTNIMGGVAIVYRDVEKNFRKIGTFSIFTELNSIIHNVEKLTTKTLDEIISNRGQYRFADKIYQDYPEEMKRISDRRISTNAFDNLPELFTNEIPINEFEYIRILGRIDNERAYKYFKREYLLSPRSFEKYKVFISKANGAALKNGTIVGTPYVADKNVGATETFITIGGFNEKVEAENLSKYIKTKFARILLSILKVTADNTKEKWAKVPLQDFTPQSDIDWTKPIPEIDKQLYAKYGLDEKEIAFIEEKVTAME